MAATTHATQLEAGRHVFSRVLVGIDSSQQALDAARQAATLEDVDGVLTLLSAWDIVHGVGGTGSRVPYYYDENAQRTAAEQALTAAREYVAPYTAAITALVRGAPVRELLTEIERGESTLVAVGSSGAGRLLGIIEGEVTTEIVHRAPCSVLVARAADAEFPSRIVVGVDGSIESAAAYAAAHYLSERFGAELRALVARGGKGVDHRLAAITEGDHEETDDAPVLGLATASRWADLVVVGSRGLHGVRALGSVSERVAHGAACSTLIVRRQASSSEPRRVLIVIDEPCTSPELCSSVRTNADNRPLEAFVIAPAHESTASQWYVDEDAARADATHRLRGCLACLARDGILVHGRLGDGDPVQAIGEALSDFTADEILVVTPRQRPSRWLRPNVIDRARRTFSQPIKHIAMPTTSAPSAP